jgi:hypothetical protein
MFLRRERGERLRIGRFVVFGGGEHVRHCRCELVDVLVGVDVACRLDGGVAEELLDGLEVAGGVESRWPAVSVDTGCCAVNPPHAGNVARVQSSASASLTTCCFVAADRRDEASVVSETRRRLEVPVKNHRIEVRSVRPGDGAQIVIDVYLGEEVGVGQRLEYRAMQCLGEVDVARAAVAEPEPQLVVAKNLHRDDTHVLHMDAILRQWIDGVGTAAVLGALPVGIELLPVQPSPFDHQLECAAR